MQTVDFVWWNKKFITRLHDRMLLKYLDVSLPVVSLLTNILLDK